MVVYSADQIGKLLQSGQAGTVTEAKRMIDSGVSPAPPSAPSMQQTSTVSASAPAQTSSLTPSFSSPSGFSGPTVSVPSSSVPNVPATVEKAVESVRASPGGQAGADVYQSQLLPSLKAAGPGSYVTSEGTFTVTQQPWGMDVVRVGSVGTIAPVPVVSISPQVSAGIPQSVMASPEFSRSVLGGASAAIEEFRSPAYLSSYPSGVVPKTDTVALIQRETGGYGFVPGSYRVPGARTMTSGVTETRKVPELTPIFGPSPRPGLGMFAGGSAGGKMDLSGYSPEVREQISEWERNTPRGYELVVGTQGVSTAEGVGTEYIGGYEPINSITAGKDLSKITAVASSMGLVAGRDYTVDREGPGGQYRLVTFGEPLDQTRYDAVSKLVVPVAKGLGELETKASTQWLYDRGYLDDKGTLKNAYLITDSESGRNALFIQNFKSSDIASANRDIGKISDEIMAGRSIEEHVIQRMGAEEAQIRAGGFGAIVPALGRVAAPKVLGMYDPIGIRTAGTALYGIATGRGVEGTLADIEKVSVEGQRQILMRGEMEQHYPTPIIVAGIKVPGAIELAAESPVTQLALTAGAGKVIGGIGGLAVPSARAGLFAVGGEKAVTAAKIGLIVAGGGLLASAEYPRFEEYGRTGDAATLGTGLAFDVFKLGAGAEGFKSGYGAMLPRGEAALEVIRPSTKVMIGTTGSGKAFIGEQIPLGKETVGPRSPFTEYRGQNLPSELRLGTMVSPKGDVTSSLYPTQTYVANMPSTASRLLSVLRTGKDVPLTGFVPGTPYERLTMKTLYGDVAGKGTSFAGVKGTELYEVGKSSEVPATYGIRARGGTLVGTTGYSKESSIQKFFIRKAGEVPAPGTTPVRAGYEIMEVKDISSGAVMKRIVPAGATDEYVTGLRQLAQFDIEPVRVGGKYAGISVWGKEIDVRGAKTIEAPKGISDFLTKYKNLLMTRDTAAVENIATPARSLKFVETAPPGTVPRVKGFGVEFYQGVSEKSADIGTQGSSLFKPSGVTPTVSGKTTSLFSDVVGKFSNTLSSVLGGSKSITAPSSGAPSSGGIVSGVSGSTSNLLAPLTKSGTWLLGLDKIDTYKILPPLYSTVPGMGASLLGGTAAVAMPSVKYDTGLSTSLSTRYAPKESAKVVQSTSGLYAFSKPVTDLVPKIDTAVTTKPDVGVYTAPYVVPYTGPFTEVTTTPITDVTTILEPKITTVVRPSAQITPSLTPIPITGTGTFYLPPKSRKGGTPPKVEEKKPATEFKWFFGPAKTGKTIIRSDLFSVAVSQAAFGKGTTPKFSRKEVETLKSRGFMRVPTKQIYNVPSSGKVLKKLFG